jgi:hypothetical protein
VAQVVATVVTQDEYRAQVAAGMSEAVLQSRVESLAREFGWRVFHAPDNRPNARGAVQRITPGFPDLVLVHRPSGRILYRELKTMTGRLTPAQREWALDLTACGADVGVWRPIDYLDNTVRRHLVGE